MNLRRATALSAITALGFASLLVDAGAQQCSIKETIVGTWSVTSIYDLYEDGKKHNPWGPGVKGNFTFDRNGRFTQILIGEVVATLQSADPRVADSPSLAFIGSYTVEEEDKSVAVRNERATNSVRDLAEQKWLVRGCGDTLSLVGVKPRKDPLGTFVPHLEVSRAK